MANKNNIRTSKVVHRQTFQNSNQIIEMTLRTIPKSEIQHQVFPEPPHFERDCALRKELQNVVKEKNNNNKTVGSKNVGKQPTHNIKNKTSVNQVEVEISRKKSSKKPHKIVPHNTTWEDVLHKCSTVTSVSEKDLPLQSTASDDHPSQPVSEQSLPKQSERNSPRNENRGLRYRMKKSKTVKSSLQPSHSIVAPVLNPTNSYHQLYVDNSSTTSEHTNRVNNIPERPISKNSQQRLHTVHRDVMVNNSRNENVEPDPQNSFLAQYEQAKGTENRLLSDDVNASPFGESALMLLQQLKERLQSRGDSEGNDLVGVLEAVICGQGSLGGLGAGNPPPSAYKSSAHYPPVFPSESNIYSSHPSFQQRRKQENIDTRVSLNVPHEYHQNSNYHPRKVRTDPHTEQTGEEYLPQNLQDQHQMNNGFPQQTSDHPTTHRQYPYQSTVQDLQDKPIEDEATHHHTVYRDSQHHVPQETSNHNKLIQKITRQSEVMAEQERIITELRKLSSQLIAQQEKITLKNLQQDKEADAVNCDLNTNTQPPAVDMDSGVGGESHDTTGSDKIVVSGEGERGDNNSSNNKQAQQRNVNKMSQTEQNYRSELLRLQTENVALLREVRSHRELVVNLEIQLSKAYNLLDLEQQSHSKLLVSKLSSSAPNLDIVGNQARTTHDGKSSHLRAPSNPSESEADSAYEEKTGSHLTSKINSPHSDMQKGKDSATSLSEISSEKHKEDEQDQDPQGQSSNIVPTDTALLHAVYNNKDKTVLNAVMNSSTIPTSQFILQQRVPETQETPDDEVKSSVSDRPPRYNVKASDQANYHGISARKEDKTAGAQKPYFAKTIGIEANNLYMEPTAPLEECVFSSFSTVNDNNPQDSMITQETSFLKGIKAPRQNRNTISLEGKLETLEGINSSFVGLHQPLESTRLQEGSHKLPNISEDESSVFAPMKAHKSYNSTSFESVDKLD